jgi:ABC-type branched-subunit amino acid transport system permease subunit
LSELFDAEFWSFVGVIAGVYTVLALGLQLQFGYAGLLNFGQVAFMAIGAYAMAILTVRTGLGLWLSALVAIAIAMAVGALLSLTTLRLRADFFAIVTIAFGEIVRYLALNEGSLTGGPRGTVAIGGTASVADYNASFLTFADDVQDWLESLLGPDLATRDFTLFVIVWAVVLALLALVSFCVHSPWGRTLRSIRDDEDAAAAIGKNVMLYRAQVLVLGSALGAVAGLLYAFQASFFSPDDFDPLTTFFAWTVIILGGVGRVWAVPVGALVFGVIYAGTRFFDFVPFSYFDSADRAYLRLAIIGVLLIALMAFRPQGLLGRRQEMLLE